MSVRLPVMQILVLIGAVGASPQIGDMWLCDFFDCPVLTFFLDPTPRSNRWSDFHTLWLKRRVSVQGWSFWGLERWVTIFGENMPPKLPKMGVNRQFPAKTAKYKNRNISKAINQIKTKLRIKLRPAIALRGWSNITEIKSNIAAGGHLEKIDISRHNSAADRLITTKFGRQM